MPTQNIYDLVDTWNAGGTTFTAVKMNVTDTASAAGSLLMDLQVGGSSKFNIAKNGALTSATDIIWKRTNGNSLFYIGTNNFYIYEATTSGFGIADTSVRLSNDYAINWTNGAASGTRDLFLTRRGTANLRLGAADAAAPVAQTLSVQSVVAGTSNTAGANLTITGSQGTGTGAGGSIIFQVAPAGSSGTAQNALATALTIASNKTITQGDGSYWLTDANAFVLGAGTGARAFVSRNDFSLVPSAAFLGWGDLSAFSSDVRLYRDATNTLALRNGANNQELRVYGSYTDATNYQRMSIKTLRESSGALSGASYTTTIAIPAYANLIGVTTRVTTAVTGATSYSVGDGTTVGLWGATIGVALGSQSRTADFTAVGAVGAAATSRTVTLTANGSNFTGGVVEICLHYLTTEAD